MKMSTDKLFTYSYVVNVTYIANEILAIDPGEHLHL